MSNFQPDWASSPGQTIKQVMNRKALLESDLFEMLDIDSSTGLSLLKGSYKIDSILAEKLSNNLGASPSFWLRRQQMFDEQLSAIQQEKQSWLSSFPLDDMVRNRILTPRASFETKYRECLKFFNVCSVREWDVAYGALMKAASFRTSQSFDSVPASVITWLRQGELVAHDVECEEWNPDKLESYIPQIRSLSRISCADTMLQSLTSILAECGVGLAIVKCPKGCRASGATYFLDDNKAMLILSFRYLSDDHFWFSLFHEIGHLLLHDKKGVFLDGLDETSDEQENEANDFAAKVLIPPMYNETLKSFKAKDWRSIVRFAKSIDVSAGIVVGQLQHRKIIHYGSLNKLKNRYSWK